jgi:hypothetical protein
MPGHDGMTWKSATTALVLVQERSDEARPNPAQTAQAERWQRKYDILLRKFRNVLSSLS